MFTDYSSIPMEYRQCRSYGHMWDSQYVDIAPSFYIEALRCDRCGAERKDKVMRMTGHVQSRTYKYPGNYAIEGKLDRGMLRLSSYEGRV